ncbi:MAG TPA: class I SAM-dependent methyltransferase [Thermoanaerobaculia bacterium]|jgi:SAM-dependent methyltransferase
MLAEQYRWALDCLSPYERDFYEIEVERRPRELYVRRLQRLGFEGFESVLDIACGLGQWSLALAELNARVAGIDVSAERLLIANLLAVSAAKTNVEFRWSRMEALPFAGAAFDAAFCYGAFMFGNGKETLRELHRVLRPNALLYVNANGAGFYLSRVRQRGLSGALALLRMTANGAAGRDANRTYSRRRLARLLEENGFAVQQVADEGAIGGTEAGAAPFYPGKWHGLDAVFEVLARRR